jgi:hypothetical protein
MRKSQNSAAKLRNEKQRIDGIRRSNFSKTQPREKPENCFLCQRPFKEVGGVVNSHTIKAETLSNLCADKGVLISPAFFEPGLYYSAVDHKGDKIRPGVSEAGTFSLVCGGCDANFFFGYEDKVNKQDEFTQSDLAEIVIKNSLFDISESKRRKALSLAKDHTILEDSVSTDFSILLEQKAIREIYRIHGSEDAKQTDRNIERAISCIVDEIDTYEKIFDFILDHTIPLAIQTSAFLSYFPDGRRFQNIKARVGHISEFFLCAFPGNNGKTRILCFYDKVDDRLNAARKDFAIYDEMFLAKYFYVAMLKHRSYGFFYSPLAEKSVLAQRCISTPISTPEWEYKSFEKILEISANIFEEKYSLEIIKKYKRHL